MMLAALMAWAPILRADEIAMAPVGVPEAQPEASYKLAPKDIVHIRVFQEDDLETTATIDKDGNVAFPLLGMAKIGGETVQDATATMETLLKEYLIKPQVSLEIVSYSKQRFTILGQVNRPGVFDMPDESLVDLLEAVGMAGGYTKLANPAKITVKRIADGRESIIKIDGKKMLKDPSIADFEIMPGDTIVVGEAIF